MNIYELEVENLLEEGGVERLKSQFMNLSIRLDEVSSENKELRRQISKLEAGSAVQKETIPFSDEQNLEDYVSVLQEQHQNDCITINQLQTTIDTLVDRCATLRGMRRL